MSRTLQPPEWETWNFAKCPDEELRLCLYYEAAREVELVKEYINSQTYKRSSPIKSPYSKYIAFTCPEFPETPWLKIAKDKRSAYLKKAEDADKEQQSATELVVPNHLLHLFVEKLTENIDTSLLYKGEDDNGAHIGICPIPEREATWAAIQLDASKSRAMLVKGFKKFLRSLPDCYFDKPSNRGKPFDRLRQITAKRLRDYCAHNGMPNPLDCALNMWQKAVPGGNYYSELSSASRAICSIEQFLGELYQLTASTPDPFDGTDRGPVLSVQDI